MSDDEESREIASRARRHLDRSAEELDALTQVRLRAARLRALETLESRRVPGRRRLLVSTGVAGALGALAAVSLWSRQESARGAFPDGFEDVEILTATDDLELYDDLDFYRWLEDGEPI